MRAGGNVREGCVNSFSVRARYGWGTVGPYVYQYYMLYKVSQV